MARLARLVLPGIPHHVTQRGNRRQPVFFEEDDYAAYVELVSAACVKHDVRCLAWCLMPNHVHVMVVPGDEDGLRRYTARSATSASWPASRPERPAGQCRSSAGEAG